jgi:protocatechuate 3,4-dioxygenase beta subunit
MIRTTIGLSVALLVLLAIGAGPSAGPGSACPASNPPNTLVLSGGSGQTAQLGRQFQGTLQVALANTDGCPLTGNLAGISVDFVAPGGGASGIFAATGNGVAVVGTDAQGTATAPPFTANDTAGSYSVDAESDYGTVRLYLTNTAGGLPASIAVQGAAEQEASVNSRYGLPLQARVTDANGNPVQGAAVSFAIVPGVTGAGASFLGGQGAATTDSNGIATSPPLLANGSAGRFAATASTDGLSAVATYALDNHAASMRIETTATSDPTATVNSRYRTPLEARVLDASGQPVEGASVTFSVQPSDSGAGATFVGGAAQATELTDANGVATSPPLLANKTAGTYSATATAAGGSQAATYTLENRAAAPAAITAGAASGESTPARTRFPVRLAVTVVDKDGNAVAGATVVFSAPAHGPSGRFAVRKGTTTRTVRVETNGKGIAVAPPFAAGATPGGYVVTAVVKGTAERAAFALVNRPRP